MSPEKFIRTLNPPGTLPPTGATFSLGRGWKLTGECGEERPQWLVWSPGGESASIDAAFEWGEVEDPQGRCTKIPKSVLDRLDRYADILEPIL
jgi:hypothetical protein